MSDNTLRGALRRTGYTNDEMTLHGFRAMAWTILVEQFNVNPDVIEAQLARGKNGPLGAAHDRAEFIAQRRKMMTLRADDLDDLRRGATAPRRSRKGLGRALQRKSGKREGAPAED